MAVLLAACNVTRSVPDGDHLYTGATVELRTDSLDKRTKKVLQSDLQGLTRPKPNARLLGVPLKLIIYNALRNKKPNSFWGKLRDKQGQQPVLLSSVDLGLNTTNLDAFLENKGFFRAEVSGDSTTKGKKGSVKYVAIAGPRYTIDSVIFPGDTSAMAGAIRESSKESLLKPGAPFDLDLIKGERTRIDAYVKERGFYFFSPEFLLAQVDSTDGLNKVDMRLVLKPETPEEADEPYRIRNVYIYSGYTLNAARQDTSKNIGKLYNGYYVIDPRNRYRPILFDHAMQFRPGDLYNRVDHNQTLNRLINLNQFRFVKNRFEPIADSNALDAYYYLTPLPRKSLRGEVTTTSKSNNLNGIELSFSWRNRNTFRAGELLNLTGYVGSETQFGGQFKGYNTYRLGAEANLLIPRFAVPFFDVRTRGGYMPQTKFTLGYDVLNRRKLYTLNSFRGSFGYVWQESVQKRHEFNPVSITYVQPINVTQEYRDSIVNKPYLSNIIDSQFVLGTNYNYNYNDLSSGVQKINSYYFNGLVDFAGNVAGLVTGGGNAQDPKRIFSAVFDQYIKLETDVRFYRRIGTRSTWANRIIAGFGLPYGNSVRLPYVKQYFAGGNNSLRAFRSRTLGPGTYRPKGDLTFTDQTGDIRLEFNSEFRPHITGPLYGALFVDAGNIWLKNEDPFRPGSKFTKDWFKQLAVGVGAGVRLDITLFVIRLDLGIPVRKPWEDNPRLFQGVEVQNAAWRKDNLIYNLAIGYPF
jgi:outer membrane protein insertion porin family